jgi:hypothetical protein
MNRATENCGIELVIPTYKQWEFLKLGNKEGGWEVRGKKGQKTC